MPRVVPEDVNVIRHTTEDALPFILTANMFVDAYLSEAALPERRLWEIERWLSAHYMEVAAPTVSKKDMGATSVTYALGKLGEGLKSTRYGQQAIFFDTSGILAALGVAAEEGGTVALTKKAVFEVW